MKGASTSVVEELQCTALYATEVASPKFVGASTLVVEELQCAALYVIEVASPKRVAMFGVATEGASQIVSRSDNE